MRATLLLPITFRPSYTLVTSVPTKLRLSARLSPHLSSKYSTMSSPDALIESAKREAAKKAVEDHFPRDAKYVGIGSGTTIVFVVEAIKALGIDTSGMRFVPTGYQSRMLVKSAGLTDINFDSLPDNISLDAAFDGADEVDDDLNCIKGGGACLFQEKLVAMRAKKFICVADFRKLQKRLITKWKSVPIEVAPLAAHQVQIGLRRLGASDVPVRVNPLLKSGPLKTDQDFFIIDAVFPQLLIKSDLSAEKDGSGKDGIWEVEALALAIKEIQGVLEVGLFVGKNGPDAAAAGVPGGQKPVAAYFGMEDGSVEVRTAAH